MPSAALPAITCGLRGIAYCELAINGAMRDSHSGDYGGALENPLHVLGRLIASLHDADRQVAVPGFYDAVDAVSPQMRETIRGVPFDETDWLENVGARCAVTETGYTPREATTARPATNNKVTPDGNRTAVVIQYQAGDNYDGHFVAQRNSNAVADWLAFLTSAVGGTPQVD